MIGGGFSGGLKIPEILRFLVIVVILAAMVALLGTVVQQETTNLIVLAAQPNQPVNLAPVDAATEVSLNPTLECSAFSDSDSDSHIASQWRITAVQGDYSTPAFDSGTDNASLTQIAVPAGVLSDNTTYYWQVRHYDSGGEWSEWSVETSFATLNHAPAQPVNQSPADGEPETSLNPELRSSAFSDPDEGDTHAASQWLITDNSSTTVLDSGTDNVSLERMAIAPGILSDNTTYFWKVRHQDSHGAWSGWSSPTSFHALNHAPSRPTNESPVGEASLNPTLKSSPFTDQDFGDTHASSQWRITTIQGDYSSPVFDSGTDNSSLTDLLLASGILSENVAYFWQVRHLDNHGAWSEWSAENSFVPANHAPSHPDTVSPPAGATDTTIPVKLESSAFADPDENDSHAVSRWQITRTEGDYGSPLCDRIELSSGELTSITVDLGVLKPGITYFWRVQHQDNHGVWSGWSAESSFTPVNQPPAKPGSLSPASGTSAVSLTPTLGAEFSDPDGAQDHQASHWQISTIQGSYEAPLYDLTSETTSITVPEGVLSISTTYYWRVQHQDAQGVWSEWSDEASFTARPALPNIDEGGGIPFWVWIIVGVAAAGIVGGVVIWRLRSTGQE